MDRPHHTSSPEGRPGGSAFCAVHIVGRSMPGWLPSQISDYICPYFSVEARKIITGSPEELTQIWQPEPSSNTADGVLPRPKPMWVRRHDSLEAALAAYSTGDVVLLLKGEHILCGAANKEGGPRVLPDGVTILGVDPTNPQKVLIRHQGIVLRSADTATFGGLTLQWLGSSINSGASRAGAPSSLAPHGVVPAVGLRVTLGRLALIRCSLHCEMGGECGRDAGAASAAAAAAIWVGPGCSLDMATSVLSSTAEVGVKLAPGAAAVFMRSTLVNKGRAVVCAERAAPPTAAGPPTPRAQIHATPSATAAIHPRTSLVIGACCKLEVAAGAAAAAAAAAPASGAPVGTTAQPAAASSPGSPSSSPYLVLVIKRPEPPAGHGGASATGAGAAVYAATASGAKAYEGIVLLMNASAFDSAPGHVIRYAIALCGHHGPTPAPALSAGGISSSQNSGQNSGSGLGEDDLLGGAAPLGPLRLVCQDNAVGLGSVRTWLAHGISRTEGVALADSSFARLRRSAAFPLFKAVVDAAEAHQGAAAAAEARVPATAAPVPASAAHQAPLHGVDFVASRPAKPGEPAGPPSAASPRQATAQLSAPGQQPVRAAPRAAAARLVTAVAAATDQAPNQAVGPAGFGDEAPGAGGLAATAAGAAIGGRTPGGAKPVFGGGAAAALVSPMTLPGPAAQPAGALTPALMTGGPEQAVTGSAEGAGRDNAAAFGGLSPAPFSPYGFRGGVLRRGKKHTSSSSSSLPPHLRALVPPAPVQVATTPQRAPPPPPSPPPPPPPPELQLLAPPPQQQWPNHPGLHSAHQVSLATIDCTPPRGTQPQQQPQAGAERDDVGFAVTAQQGAASAAAADSKNSPADSKDSTLRMLLECLGSQGTAAGEETPARSLPAACHEVPGPIKGRQAPPPPPQPPSLAAQQLLQLGAALQHQQQQAPPQPPSEQQAAQHAAVPCSPLRPGMWHLQLGAVSLTPSRCTGPRVAASAAEVAARSAARAAAPQAPPSAPPAAPVRPPPPAPSAAAAATALLRTPAGQAVHAQPSPFPTPSGPAPEPSVAITRAAPAPHRPVISAFAAANVMASAMRTPADGAAAAAAASPPWPDGSSLHSAAQLLARVPSARLGSVDGSGSGGLGSGDLAAVLALDAAGPQPGDSGVGGEDDSVLVAYLAFQGSGADDIGSNVDEDCSWWSPPAAVVVSGSGAHALPLPPPATACGSAAPLLQWVQEDFHQPWAAAPPPPRLPPPSAGHHLQPPQYPSWFGLPVQYAAADGPHAAPQDGAAGGTPGAPLPPWWELQRRQQALGLQQHQQQQYPHHQQYHQRTAPAAPPEGGWAFGRISAAASAATGPSFACGTPVWFPPEHPPPQPSSLHHYPHPQQHLLPGVGLVGLLPPWAATATAHQKHMFLYQSALRNSSSSICSSRAGPPPSCLRAGGAAAAWETYQHHAATPFTMVPVTNHLPTVACAAPLTSIQRDGSGNGGIAAATAGPDCGAIVAGDIQSTEAPAADGGAVPAAAATVAASAAAAGALADSFAEMDGQGPQPAQQQQQEAKPIDKEQKQECEARRAPLRQSLPRACRGAARNGHEKTQGPSAASLASLGATADATAGVGTTGPAGEPAVEPEHAAGAGGHATNNGAVIAGVEKGATDPAVEATVADAKVKTMQKRKTIANVIRDDDSGDCDGGDGDGRVPMRGGKTARPNQETDNQDAPAAAAARAVPPRPRECAKVRTAGSGRQQRSRRRKADGGVTESSDEEVLLACKCGSGGARSKAAVKTVAAQALPAPASVGPDLAPAADPAAALAPVAAAAAMHGTTARRGEAVGTRQAPLGRGRRAAAEAAKHVDTDGGAREEDSLQQQQHRKRSRRGASTKEPQSEEEEPPPRRRRVQRRTAAATEEATTAATDAGDGVVIGAATAAATAPAPKGGEGTASGSCAVGLLPPAAGAALPAARGDGSSAPVRPGSAGADAKRPTRLRPPLQPLDQQPPPNAASMPGNGLTAVSADGDTTAMIAAPVWSSSAATAAGPAGLAVAATASALQPPVAGPQPSLMLWKPPPVALPQPPPLPPNHHACQHQRPASQVPLQQLLGPAPPLPQLGSQASTAPQQMLLPIDFSCPQAQAQQDLQLRRHFQMWQLQQQQQQQRQSQMLGTPGPGSAALASAIAGLQQQAGQLAAMEASAVQQMHQALQQARPPGSRGVGHV